MFLCHVLHLLAYPLLGTSHPLRGRQYRIGKVREGAVCCILTEVWLTRHKFVLLTLYLPPHPKSISLIKVNILFENTARILLL